KMRMVAKDDQGHLVETDLGLVGEVAEIDPAVITTLREAGFISVIAPIGNDREGQTYNINADVAAGDIAGALKAEKFILLTDVEGVLDEHGKLIPGLEIARAKALIEDGTIAEGMIPKVEC